MFLQSVGLLPDNIIVITNTREEVEKRVSTKLKELGNNQNIPQLTKEAVDQYELNLDSVRSMFKGFLSEIKFDTEQTTMEEVLVIIVVIKLGYFKIQEAVLKRLWTKKTTENFTFRPSLFKKIRNCTIYCKKV